MFSLARWWTVCDESSDDYQTFNISLGEHQLLEPLNDLCTLMTPNSFNLGSINSDCL